MLARDTQLAHWPNWFMSPRIWVHGCAMAVRRAPASVMLAGILVSSLGAAFWANAKAGTLAALQPGSVTLPLMVLWLLSWWGGWENSFNKGYEQAWVGPVIGVGGDGLIILAMTYVPLAQARQATEGTWRSFFDYRLVRMPCDRQSRMAMLKIAIGFAVAGLLIAGMRAGRLRSAIWSKTSANGRSAT